MYLTIRFDINQLESMEGFKGFVMKLGFNLVYNCDRISRNQQADHINIFGKQFQSNTQAKLMMRQLFYFTYRNDLQLNGIANNSDVGWGCMLRVVSMLVAQGLRRYQGQKFMNRPQAIYKVFINKNGPFSIERMLNRSQQLFSKKAGDWFSTSQASKIIASFINEDQTQKLRVFICDGKISKETCLNFLLTEKNQLQNYLFSYDQESIRNYNNFSQKDLLIYPGLIIINIKEGLKFDGQQGQKKLNQIKRAMKLQSFAGILGGRKNNAYYIVGHSQTSFIYLDPHQVTNQTEFHTSQMLSMQFTEADPDMAICFYVRDARDFFDLMQNIEFFHYKNVPQEFGTAQQIDFNPQQSYEMKQTQNNYFSLQQSQQFQLLICDQEQETQYDSI